MDTTRTEETNPIAELYLVIETANNLATQDAERAKLIELLKPIADEVKIALALVPKISVATQEQAESAAKLSAEWSGLSKKAEDAIRAFGADANGVGILGRMYSCHKIGTALINVFHSLQDSSKAVKAKIIAWQQDEQDKARREQERLQAVADQKAREEQERLRKAAEKIKTPELKEERLHQAAQVTAPTIHVAAPTVAIRTQKRWQVASLDKSALVQAAATKEGAWLLGFIEINQQSLARSKSANPAIEVAGVEFKHVTI